MKAIDLFAGLGGFSEGAKKAGLNVVWAANHWQSAVEYHQLNHPGAEHTCQDLHQANWLSVPPHDVMLASPACTGHSPARGSDAPHHDDARATAWAVVSCAEYHREQVIVVENVPAFLKWSLYPAWQHAMRLLGYSLAHYTIDSADHGVPQNRVRLFVVCTRSKSPIKLTLPRREHSPVSSVIEWDNYNWSPINKPGRSVNTIARAEKGRIDTGSNRFVMPYYGSGSGLTGRSIDRPIGTVTTRDRWAIVHGDKMRMIQPSEYRSIMGFPESYKLPSQRKLAIHLLGNAVCPPVITDLLTSIKKAA